MFGGQNSSTPSSSSGMSNSRGMVPETANLSRMVLRGSGVSVNGASSLSNAYVLGIPGRYDITLRQQAALMPPFVAPPSYQQQRQQGAQMRLQSSGSDYPSVSSSSCCYPVRSPFPGIVHQHSVMVGELRRSSGSFDPLPGAFHGASPIRASQIDFGLDLSRSGRFAHLPGALHGASPGGSQIMETNGQTCSQEMVGLGRPDTPRPSAPSFGTDDSLSPLSPSVLAELRRSGWLSPLGTEFESGLDGHRPPGSVTTSPRPINNGSFSQSYMFQSGPPPSPCDDDDNNVDMIESTPSSQMVAYTQQWR